jgi:beta-lactam-binding protein with PASTA domain
LQAANLLLQAAGLVVAQRGIVNTGAPPGTVVAQDPVAGVQVDQGTKVEVDLETARIAVPNVNNRSLQDAIRVLGGAQLIVAPIQPVYFSEAPFDVVSAQNPAAGATVPPGTPVTLSVRTYSPRLLTGVILNTAVLQSVKLYARGVDGGLRAAPREE